MKTYTILTRMLQTVKSKYSILFTDSVLKKLSYIDNSSVETALFFFFTKYATEPELFFYKIDKTNKKYIFV